jgi:hypothetical protein
MREITCPVCNENNWKLFKWSLSDDVYFRIACANGCYTDNANRIEKDSSKYSVMRTAFDLIDIDREAQKR